MGASQSPEPASRSLAASAPALASFGAAHSTLTLATTTSSGLPQAASLFFAVAADGSLIFVSGAESRHSLNIAANGQAAVTIHTETWKWHDIAGVQMEGSVRAVPAGPEREAAWDTYRAKFPFVTAFESEVSQSTFYRFTPRWVRLIDNRVRFGFREEFTVGE